MDDGDVFGSEVCLSLSEPPKPTSNGGYRAEPAYRNHLEDRFVESRIALLMELKQGSVAKLLAEGQCGRRRVSEVVAGLGSVRSSIGLLAVRFDGCERLHLGEGFGLGWGLWDRIWGRKLGAWRMINERSGDSQVAYRHLAMYCALHVIRFFRHFLQLSHCPPQAQSALRRALLGGIGEDAEGRPGDEPSRGLIVGELVAVLARSIGRQHV
jgi:hypothetical protein